jgi:hypothetical protein
MGTSALAGVPGKITTPSAAPRALTFDTLRLTIRHFYPTMVACFRPGALYLSSIGAFHAGVIRLTSRQLHLRLDTGGFISADTRDRLWQMCNDIAIHKACQKAGFFYRQYCRDFLQ